MGRKELMVILNSFFVSKGNFAGIALVANRTQIFVGARIQQCWTISTECQTSLFFSQKPICPGLTGVTEVSLASPFREGGRLPFDKREGGCIFHFPF